jgi:predicted Abi (CAAX) family protease
MLDTLFVIFVCAIAACATLPLGYMLGLLAWQIVPAMGAWLDGVARWLLL